VTFQTRRVGTETDKRLIWVDSTGLRRLYWVDRSHAGFHHVVLKQTDDGMGVWVESDGKVGASLRLDNGDFRGEFFEQFPWAVYGQGITVGQGTTGSVVWLLVPW
jgi:hypothetical protein